MTGDKRRKPDKRSINKKPLNPNEKLGKKRYFERKVVNEKLPDLGGVLRRKPTLYD